MRNFFGRLRERWQHFMWGRYGVDQLNLALLIAAVILNLAGILPARLLPFGNVVYLILSLLSYVLLGLYLFRTFSRNLNARRRENTRFLSTFRRLRDRDRRYFRCPNCKQTVRVPKGRGRICIHCPRCGEKFIRKS